MHSPSVNKAAEAADQFTLAASPDSSRSAPHYWKLLWLAGLAVAYVIYASDVENNPPGFLEDEASSAYNAYRISQTGSDEFGVRWPVYFRSSGDYKSPLYIYAEAAVFKLTGPSI